MLMSGGSFQQLGIHPLLGFLTVPWNCHGTSECVIQLADQGLRLKDQGLVEFDLSAILDPFDFNQFMLSPWAMPFFQKLRPVPFPPVSCSFPERLPSPQCCLYNLTEGQPENSWPWGGKH